MIKLEQTILGTIDLIINSITQETFVSIDISDIKHVFKNRKTAAISSAESDDYTEAAEKAASCEVNDIKGALIFIQGPQDMTLGTAKGMVEIICRDLDDNADIVWNAAIRPIPKYKVNIVFVKDE